MVALSYLLKISETLRKLLDYEDLRALEIDEAYLTYHIQLCSQQWFC